MRAPARWHHRGQPVVYLSENAATALLEVCVHTAANQIPPNFTLLKVVGPDLEEDAIDLADLPPDWKANERLTRDLGTRWLQRNDRLLLRIPSVIVPASWNYLFNPVHPDAKLFEIAELMNHPFDARLKR